MSNSQKGFVIPILGMIIIILVIVVGLYYLNSKKVTNSSILQTKMTSIPVSNSGNYNNDLKTSLQKAFK